MEKTGGGDEEEVNDHPIEEVRNTVPITDDPSEPCLTFRTWVLGMSSCVMLAFVNEFFKYRFSQLSIGTVLVQIASLPIGRLMASTLPEQPIRVPLTGGRWYFSLNPGPFSLKEHCLITIFAGAGSSTVYALNIIAIVKVFYKRQINPYAAMLLAQTTQLLGYGWAGLFRKFLVDSAYMWWPINLVQSNARGGEAPQGRADASAILHHRHDLQLRLLPHSQLPVPDDQHRLGALPGVQGLGDGAADRIRPQGPRRRLLRPRLEHRGRVPWQPAGIAGVHHRQRHGRVRDQHLHRRSPALLDQYLQRHALPARLAARLRRRRRSLRHQSRPRPQDLRAQPQGVQRLQPHQRQRPLRHQLRHQLRQPHVHALACRALSREIRDLCRKATAGKAEGGKEQDVHTRIMKRNYKPVPQWWFHLMLVIVLALSLFTCEGFGRQLQLPYWGLLLTCAIAFSFTLPIGVISATTNMQPGLNVITELIIGYLYPGKPLANVVFKTYGFISMGQALSFVSDFKLGHYMKIPPRSMFFAQLAGTLTASTMHFATAWWLLTTVKDICDVENLPAGSPWTCPGDDVFYNASIIWGVVGPLRMFGRLGNYWQMNYFFLVGLLAPVLAWLLQRAYPRSHVLRGVNLPLIFAGASGLLPARSVNFLMWGLVGFLFNHVVYRQHKAWWMRYNYVLAAGLDAGVAFMGVLTFVALGYFDVYGPRWWGGVADDRCDLATCPTAPGVVAKGCPVV
ncbi:hypothetical protein SEVIR_6G121300v4 [Setaria viridis]|nr:oligopeptide transporter 1-like isoform X2 [Setaria viridis]